MLLIGRELLAAFARKHADARGPLDRWARVVTESAWSNFAQLRLTMPNADQVKLDREYVVTVFNIGGNKYRLISEVDYGLQVVRVRSIMTDAVYAQGAWKGRTGS